VRVLSWNILADAYIAPEYFPFSDVRHLDPMWRRGVLLDRLAASSGMDVLCLQEIEPEVFAAASARLEAYGGRFLAKIGRPDGCAIFVKKALDPNPEWREIVYRDPTGHGALAVVAAGIGIATTHLKWQPPEIPAHERLGVAQLSELVAAFVRPSEPWIVGGDLNADAASPTLKVAFDRGLVDAYAKTPDAYTSNANRRAKRIDFLLHSSHLRATPTALPKIDDQTPLPSATEPSDHLAISADFVF
jgi:hypothetical protein